jgi:hypothetical protein
LGLLAVMLSVAPMNPTKVLMRPIGTVNTCMTSAGTMQ